MAATRLGIATSCAVLCLSSFLVAAQTPDDAPGVAVSTRTLSIDENRSGTYTLNLATQPEGEVTVTLSAEPPTDVVTFHVVGADWTPGTPITATFDQSDWDRPKTVGVFARDDDDGEDGSVTISHAVTGYGSVTSADSVSISVTDDDPPAVLIDRVSVPVTEGGTATYTVKLATRPGGTVTVTPTSADEAVATVSGAVTLTTTNWYSGQSVTVTGVEDDDGAHDTTSVSHSVSGYGNVTSVDPVSVTVADDDAALVLTTKSIRVYEGLNTPNSRRNQTYQVSLAANPAGAVTVTPKSRDETKVSVSGPLTFNAQNWAQGQNVVLTGVLDEDGYDHEVTIDHSVTGYDAPPAALEALVEDYHGKSLSVQPRALELDEGEEETYSVRLRTDPGGQVTVTPSVEDDSVATVSGAMTFDSSNWSDEQTATVTAASDDDVGDKNTSVTHSVSGYAGYTDTYPGDYFFHGNSAPVVSTVAVTVKDDDFAALSLSRTSVTVTEAGGAGRAATYRIAPAARPTANMTITIASEDIGIATVAPAELTFTPAEFVPGGALTAVGKTVTVTAVDDDLDNDPDRTTTITHNASGGGYDDTSVSVDVTVTDDDIPGVAVSTRTVNINENSTPGTYTLKRS